jgi:hypothetical protein
VTAAGTARRAGVLRLDPRTGCLAGAGLGVGRQPQAVAASGATLWVVTAAGLARVDLVACGRGRCARPAWLPAAPAPVWLESLQMVSARNGWALAWTTNPASPVPAALAPVHTTDGGRTWTAVSPAPAKPLLAPDGSDVVLVAVSPSRAWLALTGTGSGARPAVTEVFGTADGGRSWTPAGAHLRPRRRPLAGLQRSRARLAAARPRRRHGKQPGAALPHQRRRTGLVAHRGKPAVEPGQDRQPERAADCLRQDRNLVRHPQRRLADQRLLLPGRRRAGHPRRRRPLGAPGAAPARGRLPACRTAASSPRRSSSAAPDSSPSATAGRLPTCWSPRTPAPPGTR